MPENVLSVQRLVTLVFPLDQTLGTFSIFFFYIFSEKKKTRVCPKNKNRIRQTLERMSQPAADNQCTNLSFSSCIGDILWSKRYAILRVKELRIENRITERRQLPTLEFSFPRLVVFCLLSRLLQLKDMKRLMVYERKRKG